MSLGFIEKIPSEWETILLIEVVNPKQWKTIATKDLLDDGYTVYGANGKIGFYNKYTHKEPIVLITCRGATCGNIHITEPFSYVNGNAMALDGLIENLYGLKLLYYVLRARGLNDVISGSAQPQITRQGLVNVKVPLPPITEQKIIGEKLDLLLAQVQETKSRLEQIPELLKQFRQSVLSDAVSGKLTEDLSKENYKKTIEWKSYVLGDLAYISTGKTPSRKIRSYWENGNIPWLTSSCTGNSYTYQASQFITDNALKECSLKLFPKGTLLLAMYGEGKTRGQVTELKISGTCNQACAAIIVKENINREFIKICLRANYEETRKVASGGAQPNLNLNKVKNIHIQLPIRQEEQNEIVRRVEQLFAYADKIEQQVNTALEKVNHLPKSILAKAFRGELTAQWRAENPDLITGENSAASLLEKIQVEREQNNKKKNNQCVKNKLIC